MSESVSDYSLFENMRKLLDQHTNIGSAVLILYSGEIPQRKYGTTFL